jgi:hypothetical protein
VEEFIGAAAELRRRVGRLRRLEARAVVAALVDHIVIRPGVRGRRVFDAERVEPVWRA